MPGIVTPMGTIVSPRALGGGAAEGWTRPADWLTLPTLTDGNERAVGLFAVYEHDSNFVAFRFRGAYTEDWGDGSAPENVADNTTAEHNFAWADIGAGTLSTRGYRQAIVSITPQGGSNLTLVSFDYRHSQAGISAYATPWLDIAVAGQLITSIAVGNTTGKLQLLEQFTWVGTVSASLASMLRMFGACYSLQSVPLFDTSNVTSMREMFQECRSFQSVPLFDTSNVTDMLGMFQNCYSLQSVPLFVTSAVLTMQSMFNGCHSLRSVPLFNTANVTDMLRMCLNCYSLQSVALFDLTDATTMYEAFRGCLSLQLVPAMNTSGVTTMTNLFLSDASLGSAPLAGTVISHSFASCKLNRAALVAIFNGLGSAAATITITGNWGIADLTAADRLIATNKGWTIVE